MKRELRSGDVIHFGGCCDGYTTHDTEAGALVHSLRNSTLGPYVYQPVSFPPPPPPPPPPPHERTCGICAEERAHIPPRNIAARKCRHERTTCGVCVAAHIREHVRGKGQVANIECPEADCDATLSYGGAVQVDFS